MFETVSVDEALKKGRRMKSLPATLIMLGCIGGALFLLVHFRFPPWVLTMGFALAFVFSWLYRGMMSMKWRLWAFENVRNVNELKKKAIKASLMWNSRFLEAIAIKTPNQKEKWKSMQYKFAQPDVFTDDYSVPDKTFIYYSKKKGLRDLIWIIPCMGLGLYFMIIKNELIAGILMMLIPGIFLFIDYRIITNKNPQIVLSKNGIETATTQFYAWKDINGEEVRTEQAGKSSSLHYLVYNYPGNSARLHIDNFDITSRELENLMEVYRGRAEQVNKPLFNEERQYGDQF